MNLTEREKLLLQIFPAILIFTIYTWVFGTTAQTRMNAAEEQRLELEQELSGAATAQQIWQQRSRLKELEDQLEGAERRQTGLRQEADELTGVMTARRRDIDAIDMVTALLRRHRLLLEEDGPARGAETAGMGASLDQATRTLEEALATPRAAAGSRAGRARPRAVSSGGARSANHAANSRIRRIRFHGRFPDVQAALQELADTGEGVVAISLEMAEIGASGLYSDVRHWTLWIQV